MGVMVPVSILGPLSLCMKNEKWHVISTLKIVILEDMDMHVKVGGARIVKWTTLDPYKALSEAIQNYMYKLWFCERKP